MYIDTYISIYLSLSLYIYIYIYIYIYYYRRAPAGRPWVGRRSEQREREREEVRWLTATSHDFDAQKVEPRQCC